MDARRSMLPDELGALMEPWVAVAQRHRGSRRSCRIDGFSRRCGIWATPAFHSAIYLTSSGIRPVAGRKRVQPVQADTRQRLPSPARRQPDERDPAAGNAGSHTRDFIAPPSPTPISIRWPFSQWYGIHNRPAEMFKICTRYYNGENRGSGMTQVIGLYGEIPKNCPR